jgi:hypothetical protein
VASALPANPAASGLAFAGSAQRASNSPLTQLSYQANLKVPNDNTLLHHGRYSVASALPANPAASGLAFAGSAQRASNSLLTQLSYQANLTVPNDNALLHHGK